MLHSEEIVRQDKLGIQLGVVEQKVNPMPTENGESNEAPVGSKIYEIKSVDSSEAIIDPEGSFDEYISGTSFPSPRDLLSAKTIYIEEPSIIKYTPETEFHYSDIGFAVLELLIEDLVGEPFVSAIDKLVFAPLGLKQTFFWNGLSKPRITEEARLTAGHDKYGNMVKGTRVHYPNLSGSGLWTTTSDMALIVMEFLKSWAGDHTSLLSQKFAQKMLAGNGSAPFAGLGVFLYQTNREACMISKGWGKGYQCMLVAYPRLKSGIVFMTNSEPGKPQDEAFVGEAIRIVSREHG